MDFAKIYQTIRRWSVDMGGPYDTNGVTHLLIAALDNLRENALDAELDDIANSFTPEQAKFLVGLAERSLARNTVEQAP